jgi:hypothetical protein
MGAKSDEQLRFLEVFERLPAGGLLGTSSDAFGIAEMPEPFVAPTLRTVLVSDDPRVTFVSARGATGKSVFAERLSAMKRAPLWRLDQDTGVSADAFAAKLTAFLGPNGVRRFRSEAGALVIIDALDEARMRVSGLSWTEFLDSLVEHIDPGGNLILLGRERIVEDVWLHLEDANVECAWYEISHFDRSQRVQYVDARVAARNARNTGTAYVAARDAALDALEDTVDPELSEAFVGYAPVLDAVVALLADKNLAAVSNTFSGPVRAAERVSVLITILKSLLNRERDKTSPAVQELGLPTESAYGPDEQLEWLSAEIFGGREPELSWCPPEQRGDYVKRIREFLRDHPFRSEQRWASPVFSAYAAARRFGDVRIRESLHSVGLQTGLLYDFVTAEGEATVLDEWQFAALHASMLSAEWQSLEVEVSIEPSATAEPSESAKGEFLLFESGQTRRTRFELVLDHPGAIVLMGPTSFLSVDFDGNVRLRSPSQSLTLGPECFIHGDMLDVRADTIEIARRAIPGSTTEDPSVVLEATSRIAIEGVLVGRPTPEIFEIRLPDDQPLVYPWVTFRSPVSMSEADPDERATRFLKMLMVLLRRHGHSGRMAVFDKKLHGRQAIKQGAFRNAIQELEKLRIVSYEEPLIYLEPEWEEHRFSGKGLDGFPTLEDKRDEWREALERVSASVAQGA